MTFAQRIYQARVEHSRPRTLGGDPLPEPQGWAAARIGVNRATLNRWERGKRVPHKNLTRKQYRRLAGYLSMSLEELDRLLEKEEK